MLEACLFRYIRPEISHVRSRRRGSCLEGCEHKVLDACAVLVTWVKFYGELAVCLFDFQLGSGRRDLQGIVVFRIDDHG